MRFFEVNDEKGYATPVMYDPEVQCVVRCVVGGVVLSECSALRQISDPFYTCSLADERQGLATLQIPESNRASLRPLYFQTVATSCE